jgi:CBS domain-containing protein
MPAGRRWGKSERGWCQRRERQVMKSLDLYCVDHRGTIMNAVEVIHRNMTRCCIVVNEQKKVVGVFSEGDVMRAILQDISLYTPVANVVKPSFEYLTSRDLKAALKLIRKLGITLVPVLNDHYRLVDVVTMFDVLDSLPLGAKKESV